MNNISLDNKTFALAGESFSNMFDYNVTDVVHTLYLDGTTLEQERLYRSLVRSSSAVLVHNTTKDNVYTIISNLSTSIIVDLDTITYSPLAFAGMYMASDIKKLAQKAIGACREHGHAIMFIKRLKDNADQQLSLQYSSSYIYVASIENNKMKVKSIKNRFGAYNKEVTLLDLEEKFKMLNI
jgi:hypothetical protein